MSLVAAFLVAVLVLVLAWVGGPVRRRQTGVMVYDGPGLPDGFVPPSAALFGDGVPARPGPTLTRCGSCPLYGCAGCRLRAVDSVGRPLTPPLVRPATPYRPRIDRCGSCVRNAAAGHEYCIDCDRAFEVIPASERGASVAPPAARLLEWSGYPPEFIRSFLNPGVEVTVADRVEPVRVYAEGGYVPGDATRAYRASLAPRRDVRGELRCLACVQPVIVDSDGVWLHHAAQCPRATMPLEVAIGQHRAGELPEPPIPAAPMIAGVRGDSCAVFCNTCGALAPSVPGKPGTTHQAARKVAVFIAGFTPLGGSRDACSTCAGATLAGPRPADTPHRRRS